MFNNNDTLSYVLNGETVCFSNSTKYLRITIDNQLSFKTRIYNLESEVARSVGGIAKLSYCLSRNTLLLFSNFIIILLFIPISFTSCLSRLPHKTYLTKLQRLQKKALRIISKTRMRDDSISSQYYKFKVLKIDGLFKFEIAKIMQRFTHKKKGILSIHILLFKLFIAICLQVFKMLNLVCLYFCFCALYLVFILN